MEDFSSGAKRLNAARDWFRVGPSGATHSRQTDSQTGKAGQGSHQLAA
jgi:hypothetical protein